MRVVVTGGCGFLGRAVSDRLSASGATVLSVHRAPPHADVPEGVTCVPVDLAKDPGCGGALRGATAVVHLAGDLLPRTPSDNLSETLSRDLMAPIAMFEESVRQSVATIVLASSGGTVYGPSPRTAAIDETAPTRPVSGYGVTKLALEGYLRAITAKTDVRGLSLRVANAYGPGQVPRVGFGVVPTFLSRILRDEPCEIWGRDGVRDYVYVDDVADAFVRAITLTTRSSPINISSGIGVSNQQLVELMGSVLNRPVTMTYRRTLEAEVTWNVLDPRRAQSLLGWSAHTTLNEGIRRTAAWLAAQTSMPNQPQRRR